MASHSQLPPITIPHPREGGGPLANGNRQTPQIVPHFRAATQTPQSKPYPAKLAATQLTQKCHFAPCHPPTPPATIPTMKTAEQLYGAFDFLPHSLPIHYPPPGPSPMPGEIQSISKLRQKTQKTKNKSKISQIRAWSGENPPILDLQIESIPNLRIPKRAPRFPSFWTRFRLALGT